MRTLAPVAALALAWMLASPAAAAPRRARIVVYDGWATATTLDVGGRVLEDHGEADPRAQDGAVKNTLATLDALESDEVRGVDVTVRVAGAAYAATTDADGGFHVAVKARAGLGLPAGAVPVAVELAAPAWAAPAARGLVHVVAAPGIGLVSDIDDTVVKTFVTDKLKMAATVLAKNARQLEPVVGAAANYAAARDAGVAAFFYVSGSPQNLYPRLRTFLDDHDFPAGPLFLKNLGEDKLLAHDEYKLGKLERIAAAFPALRFILVGDSGERDPEIYRAFQRRHPERVAAVVIRKVPGSKHVEPARFDGFVVVDDVYADERVIARWIPPPAPPAVVPGVSSPPAP